jgi:transcriptional regulator with XRE-family HTH domain
LSYSARDAARLAHWVERARRERGLSLQEFSRAARVSRPMVSRLINHAQVPAKKSTRDAIAAALGWEPGSCEMILAGGDPVDDTAELVFTAQAARRLADRVEAARRELGLNKDELGRIAGVSRPLVSRLINHAQVPARKSTRDAIAAALGWEPGTCEMILAGGEARLRSSAMSANVVAQRLQVIAAEADAAAEESQRQAERFRSIGENARAAALLALRGGAGETSPTKK